MGLFDVGATLAEKYRIEAVIGRGGMGLVLAARHEKLGHRVAIKVLSDAALAEPHIVRRFEQEARAAVQLKSVHTARILDVGTIGEGVPFIVMEYLEGEDLASRVARGALPPGEAAALLTQACEAIAEAHSLGIVHRDLKPANLFVTRDVNGKAIVKVLDFGISKVVSDGSAHLTHTNASMGTPYYMSPEQFRSARSVDLRSDVWALGVTLHELLSGARPFEGESMAEICTAVLHDAPAPLPDDGRIPPELARIIATCLDKDPAKRFASVGAFAEALAPFAGTPTLGERAIARDGPAPALSTLASAATVAAPPPPTRQARSLARVGTGAALVAGVVAVAAALVMPPWARTRAPSMPSAPSAVPAPPATSALPADAPPSALPTHEVPSTPAPSSSATTERSPRSHPPKTIRPNTKPLDAPARDDDEAPASRR